MPPNTARTTMSWSSRSLSLSFSSFACSKKGNEVIAERACPAFLDHAVGVVEQGGGRLIDLLHVLLEGDAKCEAHVGGYVGQPPPLALIEPEKNADDPRHIWFGEFRHELATAAPSELVDQLVGELGKFRLQRDDAFRRESRICEPAQPCMIIAHPVQNDAQP